MASQSWTYMGLLDDVAVKFPWKFKVGDDMLNHLLAVEIIHGKPVLLNDGYLVQHPLARQAIIERRGLLWELIDRGFMGIMDRGGGAFSLDEMPLRMAPHVDSFRELVGNRLPGIEWPVLQRALAGVDKTLRGNGYLVDWPKYHAGSGFLALARRLRDRGASPHSLGIGRSVSKSALHDFLSEFIGRLEGNLEGARSFWQTLAERYAGNPDVTNNPSQFLTSLMNLANELYHYNMGLMLAADGNFDMSVQTQTSPAFDDLLFPPAMKFLVRDMTNAPRLNVPRSVSRVDPQVLVGILQPGSEINNVRSGWLGLRAAWEGASPERRPSIERELRLAAAEYAGKLTGLLGPHVRYKEPERFIDYAISSVAPSAAAVGGLLGGPPGFVGGFAVGYGITMMKDRIVGSVVKKFRVEVLKGELAVPPALAIQSDRVLRMIKRRAAPSSIELPKEIAGTFAVQLKKF